VEFLRRRIHVHQQAQAGALAPLKTDKSMRAIPADDMLIAGITSIAEAMDTYGHLFPDDAELGRGALEALLVKHGMHQTEQARSSARSS
jgi:hypothetical protein